MLATTPIKPPGRPLLIDTHSAPVADGVWELLEFRAFAHLGPKPVLLERDGEIPSFETLLGEHGRASQSPCPRRQKSAGPMLGDYMKAMATLLGGNEKAALEQVKRAGFDPEFIAVYRNNSVSALCDVLEANYMAVHNLVGDDFFLQLVKRHIKKSPARQRSLVDYGDGFEALVSAAGDEHKLPYLTDMSPALIGRGL